MKILLISINRETSLRPVLPIGMVTIALAAEHADHTVRCVDLCFIEDELNYMKDIATVFTPDVIGISIRNIDSMMFLEPVFNPPFLIKVIKVCRELWKQVKIVLGGAGFSIVPEELLSLTHADYGIVGPGEDSFLQLLARLELAEQISDIPGLVYRDDSLQIFKNTPCYKISKRYYPATLKYFDSKYFTRDFQKPNSIGKIVPAVQSKKGCQLSCLFCSNYKIEGDSVCKWDVIETVNIIENILQYSNGFEFSDGVFNIPYDHAMNICRELVKRKINAKWGCMLNPGFVTHELLDNMSQTGCYSIEFGTDALVKNILENLHKNYTEDDVILAHELVTSYGMDLMHCIFLGAPGDNAESIKYTLDIMDKLCPNEKDSRKQVFFNFGLRIYPGTPLHYRAISEGIVKQEDSLLIPRFYISPQLLQDDMLLDFIESTVVAHNNWYLWWGLPNFSLKERIAEVSRIYSNMEQTFNKCKYVAD